MELNSADLHFFGGINGDLINGSHESDYLGSCQYLSKSPFVFDFFLGRAWRIDSTIFYSRLTTDTKPLVSRANLSPKPMI